MSTFRLLRRLLKSSDGATAVEYGLIAALIAVSIIAGAEAVGNSVGGLLNGVDNKISSAIN